MAIVSENHQRSPFKNFKTEAISYSYLPASVASIATNAVQLVGIQGGATDDATELRSLSTEV
jgi:hypothetical protein